MEKYKGKEQITRVLSLVMAAAVLAAFMPFMTGESFAAEENGREQTKAFEVMDDGTEIEVDMSKYYPQMIDPESLKDGIIIEEDTAEAASEVEEEDIDISEPDTTEEAAAAAAEGGLYEGASHDPVRLASISDDLFAAGIFADDAKGVGIEESRTEESSIEEVPGDAYNVQSSRKGDIITYSGYINAPYRFGNMYLDGPNIKLGSINSSNIDYSIDMSYFDVGYHTVLIEAINSSTGALAGYIWQTYIPVNPTIKPDSKGSIEAYSTYIRFWPYSFGTNSQAKLYMEYKPASSKKWKRSGYMTSNMVVSYYNQVYKIKGFKQNKKYNTRIRYGVDATYNLDGKTYTFFGPALKTGTFKTGKSKKPAVRSVRARAVSVKYHKVRHYYYGVYLYTEKFYTCKVKVIVKLKKKPGTKGIIVNGRYLKGNKKTYTTTFNPYPNYHTRRPRGRAKFKVSLRSYQSKKYGGYSPTYSKTKKLS
ncbi:MAG: hypothetical protein IJH95_00005 [Mogibacterium sp.]|nr:hypothetical protein [Mogibacterium sp.]